MSEEQDIVGGLFDGGGAKGVTWGNEKGQFVDGTVIRIHEIHEKDYVTETPKFWPNGKPVMTPVVTLATGLREDDDDDGRRAVYMRNNAHTAFRDAIIELGRALKRKPTNDDVIGARLAIKLTEIEPSQDRKKADRKIFAAKIWPKPEQSIVSDMFDEPAAPQPAKQPAAPQRAQPAQPTQVTADGDEVPF